MLKPITLSELMNTKYEETQWLVDGLIPALGITIMSGQPGSFKTWLLQEIAHKVSQGQTLFGKFKTQKGKVLIIDEENNHGLLKDRFKSLGVDEESAIFLSVKSGFKADDESEMDRLIEFIKEHNISLVCIDSMVRIHGKEENVANQIARVFNALTRITNQGAALLMTHHHKKNGSDDDDSSNDLRGSSDILAAVDCHLAVKVHKGKEIITVYQKKLRNAPEAKPMDLRIVATKETMSFVYEGTVVEKTKQEELQEEIITALREGSKDRMQLDELLTSKFGENAIGKMLQLLIKTGEISIDKREKGKKIYSISEPREAGGEKEAEESSEENEIEPVTAPF